LLQAAENRLRCDALFAAHPEIADIVIAKPVFIIGYFRTGTTFLNRMLACDARFRSLLFWEALNPVPWNANEARDSNGQIVNDAAMRDTIDMIAAAKRTGVYNEQFFAGHPFDALEAEEDILLLDHMLGTSISMIYGVPQFTEYLEASSPRATYEMVCWMCVDASVCLCVEQEKRLLQALQWQRPGPLKPVRWLLKSAAHLENLDTLLAVFPDAKVRANACTSSVSCALQLIQTHRRPSECVVSYAAHISWARSMYVHTVPRATVARQLLRKFRRLMTRAIAVRASLGARERQHVYDIAYHDLMDVRQCLAQVRDLYAWLELDVDDALLERFASYNRSNKYGAHRYAMADFDVSSESIDEMVRDYNIRFAKFLGN
jgi:hypothetical protein